MVRKSNTFDIKKAKSRAIDRLFLSNYYHKNKEKNSLKNATFQSSASRVWFPLLIYLNELYEYKFDNDITDYVLRKEDIYFPDIVVKQDHYKMNGLKISFPNINKKNI